MTSEKGRAVSHVSTVLFVAMHLSCAAVVFYPPSIGLVALAIGSYLLRMWAVTVGYHRYFAHRSFQTSRAFQLVLAVLGTSAMQNSPLWWASWHRRHHKHADSSADPHSPNREGFWRAHVGWFLDGSHDDPDLSNVGDLTKFPELQFLHRHKWFPIVAYGVLCFVIAGVAGIVWGFLVPTIVSLHVTASINSVAHVWGTRRFETPDRSRNNALLAFLALGEGWHNNHHHYMSAARQGFRWWEIDVSYLSIRILSRLGIVWGVREPPASAMGVVSPAKHRAEPGSTAEAAMDGAS